VRLADARWVRILPRDSRQEVPPALPTACQNWRGLSGIQRTSAELGRAEALERVAVRRQHLSFRSSLSYFHNGFAKDLWAAVDFYNTRFNIGFTKQEKSDLVAFLRSL
jgi:cytochrome c peroxidase